MTVEAIRMPRLEACPGIAHAFLGRRGGVSEGIYQTLNCGQGADDSPDAVAENRRRAVAALGTPDARLVTLHQVHSADVVQVEAAWAQDAAPHADSMVTNQASIALGIMTADCAPLLFADSDAGVIGAAHAGWRGACSGVAEATLAAMEACGAARERIRAAVGPCIGPQSYEVGPEFPERLAEGDMDPWPFLREAVRAGHFMFDLPGYVAARLRRAGCGSVEVAWRDTVREEDNFFSYRRATLRGEPDYGRLISLITLEP